jgi:hypothetical protein
MNSRSVTETFRNLLRGKVTLAFAVGTALTLFGMGAAMAASALLPAGSSRKVPPTTTAVEPDLAGLVMLDELIPFTIKNAAGAVMCAGRLQNRVVRSFSTGQLHFYYRIRDTYGPSAVDRITTRGFGGLPLRVASRTDGLGTVSPRFAARSSAPGDVIRFTLINPVVSCETNVESRFILIKTPATWYKSGGATRIRAATGNGVSVSTVRP